jgi:hypothetical protein
MMFEDLIKLFESFLSFKEDKQFYFQQSPIQMEYWAEDKAFRLDNESLKKTFEVTKSELDMVTHPKLYQKHMLNSINNTLALNDVQALSDCHRYFDYNINFIDRTHSKPIHSVKVHYPALNIAGLQLRLGHIDQALLSILETIRIS